MQELNAGSTLQNGKYRIEKVLGQGGFGITYQAKMRTVVSGDIGQMEVDVNVAIKEFFIKERCVRDETTSQVSIPSEGAMEVVEMYRSKFVKEARNMASMKHPNIVKVMDVFEENGTVYYVMQYLPGGSLSSYVRSAEAGRLPEADALRFIKEIGNALSYMHEESHTCHLDVKPGNVLLNGEGRAVLIDFGLAKNYDEAGNQTSSTPVGVSKGFAPLEQYQQSLKSFSPQTDIYSLGATLYFCLTGSIPPEASEINEDGLPPCPSYVDPAVWKVIQRAMQPRRRDRYENVREMLEALPVAAVVADEEEGTVVLTQPTNPKAITREPSTRPRKTPTTNPLPKTTEPAPKSKSQWMYILLGVLVGVVIVSAVLFLKAGSTEQGEGADSVAMAKKAKTEQIAKVAAPAVAKSKRIENHKVLDPNGNLVYTYTGEAVGTLPQGKGVAIYPKGDPEGRKKYEGEFKDGQRHGEGVLTYTNDDSFVGTFDMGHFKKGTYKISADGSSFKGTFKDDAPYNGAWLDSSGKTISQVSEGKEK